MTRTLTVAKVGGSLYDLPDLGVRLRGWLARLPPGDVLLVPGGGSAADVVRDLDRIHQLGEEQAHWLALAALRLNADFLHRLLPAADVVPHWDRIVPARSADARAFILDALAFCSWDEDTNPHAALPHRWSVTSDSVAARVAVAAGAARLILLKSVTVPPAIDWEEAAERGFVDEWFARTIRPAGESLEVRAVNLREWAP